VNLALAAVALAVGAGAVAAVSSRDARIALIGLAVALVGAALLADPLPAPATLGVRIVAALLAVAILRAVAPEPRPHDRGETANQGSRLGWPAESLLAVGAGLGGGAVALGLASGAGAGPADAASISATVLITASAMVLLALGLGPAWVGATAIRRAIGLVLVSQGVVLLRVGLAGPPVELEQVAMPDAAGARVLAEAVLPRLEERVVQVRPDRPCRAGVRERVAAAAALLEELLAVDAVARRRLRVADGVAARGEEETDEGRCEERRKDTHARILPRANGTARGAERSHSPETVLGDVRRALREVADMTDAGFDGEAAAEVAGDGARLRRRLDDDEACHGT